MFFKFKIIFPFIIRIAFTYSSDETGAVRYGLIAEEVAEVLPDLVIKDENGQPETVYYEMLSILFLKEVQKQQVIIEQLLDAVSRMHNAPKS